MASASASDKIQKSLNDGISGKTWAVIERPPDNITQKVVKLLGANALNIIQNKDLEKDDGKCSKLVMGDIYYGMFRLEIDFLDKLCIDADSKKKQPKMKKDEMIRIELTIKKLKKVLAFVKKYTFELKSDVELNQICEDGFISNYIEIVGITYIYLIKYFITHYDTYKKEIYYKHVTGVIISFQRFLKSCVNFVGIDPVNPQIKTNISQLFMTDITEFSHIVEQKFSLNGLEICSKTPELLVVAPYDRYLTATSIKCREHQIEILQKVYRHFQTGFFILYNAMINTGKTTSVVSLGEIAKYYGKILLCVCNMETVRIQMATLCCFYGTKFAMASLKTNGKIKISPNDKTKSTLENIYVIICGAEVGNKLLMENKNKYILFHDEATVGADCIEKVNPKTCQALYHNVSVMCNAPKWTIFSSATSPSLIELDKLIKHLKKEYPTLVTDKVYSSHVQVGCEIRTVTGNLVVPYSNCSTKEDIISIIHKMEDMPFICRTLTPNVVVELHKSLTLHQVPNVPDINEYFKQVENLKSNNVKEKIIEMLRIISETYKIKELCMSSIDKVPIDINNLGITSWKTMTLIGHHSPIDISIELFGSLLKKLNDVSVKSAYKLISIFTEKLDRWKEIRDAKLKKLKDSKSDGSSSYSQGLMKQSIEEKDKPIIDFPSWAQIGTSDHSNEFKYICDNYRCSNDLEKFIDVVVPDVVMMLLFCGVGIYSPSNNVLSSSYTDLVIEYASSGKLAFIVADTSIVFGTNYPFGRIIDLFENVSVATRFQLMGRAGRVGRMARADAYTSEKTAEIIKDYVIHPEKYSKEIDNINTMIDIVVSEKVLIEQIWEKEILEFVKKEVVELKEVKEIKKVEKLKEVEIEKVEIKEIEEIEEVKKVEELKDDLPDNWDE
jgi:hypothetical protein